MKKLMIAAFAVAFAAVAQAAAITWGSGTLVLSDGVTKAAAGNVTGYLFLVDATTYGNYSTITEGKALSDAIWAGYGTSLASATASKDSIAKGNKSNIVDPTVYAKGDTAYGIILYTDNTVEATTYMGNVATYKFDADSSITVENLSVFIGGGQDGSATAWSTAAVPEPTSALMLLLGMAGLALRRKQA